MKTRNETLDDFYEEITASEKDDKQYKTGSHKLTSYHTISVEDLNININSREPADFIKILNMISAHEGAVSNLGVFADIKSITLQKEVKASVSDCFIECEVESNEVPRNKILRLNSYSDPVQMPFDDLLGKDISREF